MSQLQFFDHFSEANRSLQERLGTSKVTINRDSGVLGTQVRSLIQMLSYGNDMVTTRAASHLLGMDLLHSSTAYLLKLCEGLLLNSVSGVTPPRLTEGHPLTFRSQQAYSKYSSLGTVPLLDGTPATLVAYKIDGTKEATGLYRYTAYYCAGAYVHRSLPISSLDFTPGTFTSVFVNEQYKSVWQDSVEVTLRRSGAPDVKLRPCWSMPSLLSSETSGAVLLQGTARGLTIVLGDGEVFGEGYNSGDSGLSQATEVLVSYIKCNSLADADLSRVSFNRDIETVGAVPTMAPSHPGDTAESLRLRAVSEFVAAGKITAPRDLETELAKLPIVKSCKARLEHDFPILTSSKGQVPIYYVGEQYPGGSLVTYSSRFYLALGDATASDVPGQSPLWLPLCDSTPETRQALAAFYNRYPSYQVYDNATLVLSGLVLKSRQYWDAESLYEAGDTVYYGKDGKVYKATAQNAGVAPDAADEGNPWRDATALPEDPAFDGYEEMTQAMFETELKMCHGIWQKLGFLSVVVWPLTAVTRTVKCYYRAPYSLGDAVTGAIAQYCCWEVGKRLDSSELNASLTEQFQLSSVRVEVVGDPILKENEYVRRSGLTVELIEETV